MSTAASNMPTEVAPNGTTHRPSGGGYSDLPHRALSGTSRSGPSSHTPRTDSYSQSHGRQPSGSRPSNLANVARRDFEQSNVTQVPAHASPTRETYNNDAGSAHGDSLRAARRATSRPGHGHYNTEPAPLSPQITANGTNAGHPSRSQATAASNGPRRRTTVTAQTGSWALGKTIGQGSMGKVKLARNLETGEQVAIKIVPRQSQDEHRSQQERDRADHSKEVRTAREAAIVTLVNHPFICGMRDVVRTQHHWYMLFEYVNGGQMLDYIISHGRLKEKQARKFGRQIASALDYCHRNSIVHRDLKIENILISKDANIKIIDFGLSNLFSPKSVLKTFCGSLYFAAPELLQAKAYTGPEVDIWSFGIVLYVLVCGKVPFDDQSMPQLHAKIKKGVVEYPPWLSTECKHLISRMLVTDPRQRATLFEIMSHPWMTKGFSGAPENFLPHREPLSLPLDPLVIDKMTGFDFGSVEYITEQLEAIVNADDYQKGVHYAAQKPLSHEAAQKKGGVFDFYQRRKPTISRDTLTPPSVDSLQLGEDPLNAFSPLLSIYYLAREKLDRERQETNPGAFVLPLSPGELPLQVPGLPPAPRISTPPPPINPELPVDDKLDVVPAPNMQPVEETLPDTAMKSTVPPTSSLPAAAPPHPQSQVQIQTPETPPPRKERTGASGLLRRLSTRRGRNSEREKSAPPPLPPTVAVQEPEPFTASPDPRINARKPPPSAYEKYANKPELLSPPIPTDPGSRGSLMGLGRSISVNSADLRKRWLGRDKSGTSIATTVALSDNEKLPTEDEKIQPRASSEVPKQRLSAARTKSLGHARRESIQERRANRERALASEVPEETDAELAEDGAPDPQLNGSQETMKPVYLKGLFSVSTTSNRPLSFIRSDIIRVLQQQGVEFREIKGGFSCRYVPTSEATSASEPKVAPSAHRRRISFAGLRGRDSERDEHSEHQPPKTPGTPRSAAHMETTYTNSDDSDDDAPRRRVGGRTTHGQGETTTQVQSDMSKSDALKFEIFVVKVPLLSLHGLQFKKVEGNTWQYKMMAQTILGQLRL